ncbi:IclR family transcriptional regulator [Halobium palmae]|uniref:IclR family transcriptional regulator n=1 Tax=Halobium palmae TaxID=1776492 RepID=A0ABD5RWC0_9EURY
MGGHESPGAVKSVETLLAIVETLQEHDGGRVVDVADRVGVSKSTAHRHLSTLRAHRLVTKRDGVYQLGFRFLDIGGYVREQNPVYKRIKPTLRDIAEETGEFVGFLVEQDGLGVYLYSEMGSEGVQNDVRIGRHVHLHQSAAGKAILGFLPRERARAIVDDHGLPARTPETVTDRETLFEELDGVRERGYAYARGDHTEGLWAVGVPVHDQDDDVVGGIVVAGPTHRMRGEWFDESLPDYLKGTVKEFELNISFS